MAAGKSSQSNTSLVALVIFIVLFLFCAIFATIFYTKFEDQKALTAEANDKLDKLANRSQQNKLESDIVGKVKSNQSYIGAMNEYLNEMVRIIVGELPDATASTKVNDAKIQINETINALKRGMANDVTAAFGEEGFDLLTTIADLKSKLENTRSESLQQRQQIEDLRENMRITFDEFKEEKQKLIEARDQAVAEKNKIHSEYEFLKNRLTKTTDEQLEDMNEKLKQAEAKQKEQKIEIAQLQKDLEDARSQLTEALKKLEDIKPSPDNKVMAYEADAEIFKSDVHNGLMYLNIGSEDHVYPGLTFSVFDRNAPIPKDGKGKAEIEVFRVMDNSCVAKVLSSSKKDPIIEDDIAVNLIWDSETSNSFFVMGEFDFDGDGHPDRNGQKKVAHLIELWNGRIVDEVTINTDFIVAGEKPEEMEKPTLDKINADPQIEKKYEESLEKAAKYQEVLDKAQRLSVPVFNRDRFLRLIGYETMAEKSTPRN